MTASPEVSMVESVKHSKSSELNQKIDKLAQDQESHAWETGIALKKLEQRLTELESGRMMNDLSI
jgi:hypothetical protein